MNRNGNSLQGLALRYVALALFGVVATVCSEDPAAAAPTPEEGPALSTHLYALKSESVRLESFDGTGGAIESMGRTCLSLRRREGLPLSSRMELRNISTATFP